MVKRTGTKRRKTRSLLKRKAGQRGKLPVTKYLQQFKIGEKVKLIAEPMIQKGEFHYRFYGKMGIVKDKRGSAYEVVIKDGKKEKIIITRPVHLQRV